MDWGFLNIFKKADFNTLMIAASITGWVLHYYYPDNIWILGGALICTIYCLVRFVVYIYNLLVYKAQKEKNKQYEEELRKNKENAQRLHAKYVYDRMGIKGQQLLSEIIKKGKKTSVSGVYLINKYDNMMIMYQLNDILFSDDIAYSWVRSEETADSYCITLNWPLNEIIEEKIKNNTI